MGKLRFIKIDNSKKAAVKTGKWKVPGAKFYDTLMDAMWCEGDVPADPKQMEEKMNEGKYYHYDKFLKEAYLVGPKKDHKNSPYGRTPYAGSGCKYPHHVIKGDKMVVSIPGLRAAYICARNQGCFNKNPNERPEYSRSLVAHLNRHLKELGLKAVWHHGEFYLMEETDIKIEQNFHDIYAYIMENTGINLFDDVEVFEEKSHGKLKFDFRAGIDVDTGHVLKIVYSLDGFDAGRDVSDSYIRDTRSKGDLNHQSKGQKILAIVDTTNNTEKKEAYYISPIVDNGIDEFLNNPDKLKDEIKNKHIKVFHIKVGDIDKDLTWKSTFWPKGSKGKDGYDIIDDIIYRERLQKGRGAKLNDINYSDNAPRYITYNHPSKKDIRNHPKFYKKESAMSNEAIVLNSSTKEEIGFTPEAIYEWMHNNISYDNNIDGWKLRTPSEVYMDKKGNCHDQSLFISFHLHSLGIPNGQLFFVKLKKDDPIGGNTHTLTWYRTAEKEAKLSDDWKSSVNPDNVAQGPYKYWWIETAWENQTGIHGPYNSIDDLKQDIVNIYNNDINLHKYDDIVFGKYSNARCGMSLDEYVKSWRLEDDNLFNKKSIEEQIKESAQLIYDMAHSDDSDEMITEAYTLKNLPDKMYFGTPNKMEGKTIATKSPRGLFLTPYIGIASMFIIDISKELDDYMSEILSKNGRELIHHSCNIEYDEWDDDSKELKKPLLKTHMSHNIPEFNEVKDGTASGYIYQVDVSKVKNQLQTYATNNPDRELIYKGADKLPITGVMEHTIDWTLRYKSNGQKGTFETKVIKESTESDDDMMLSFDESFNELYDLIDLPDLYYTETTESDNKEAFMNRWKYNPKKETIKHEDREYSMNIHTDIEKFKFKYPFLFNNIKTKTKKPLAAAFKTSKGPVIVVNKDFWGYEADVQDAVILHEIGHIVYQMSPKPFPKSIKELIERIKIAIQRLVARIRMMKYRKGIHGNPFHELEADIYAMQRTSRETMEKMLNTLYSPSLDNPDVKRQVDKACSDEYVTKLYKKYNKRYNYTYEQFKDMYIKKYREWASKRLQKEMENLPDRKQRLRALNDKKLTNSKFFKHEAGDNSIMYECGFHEGTGIDGDDLDWIEKYLMEEGENTEPPMMNMDDKPKKQSMPKQTDAAESDKNGVRRKKLYIAFIEWCKEYNNKNTFGSIFDKDVFHISYPFVPEEMRYFYRLANPILCVLGGNLTFFQVSELRKLNAKNSRMNEMLIFAATPNDMRVFNTKDKKVYRGTEENGVLKLNESLGDTFDIYIQKMIQKGDILNGPIEEAVEFMY